jgi:nucleoid DNA-binding protein
MQANPQEIMAANAMLAKMIALGPSGERVMLDDFAGFYRHRRMARYY